MLMKFVKHMIKFHGRMMVKIIPWQNDGEDYILLGCAVLTGRQSGL
jgi:hypothetical protein